MFIYTISASGEYAYFASENGSYGLHDLFRIKLPKELRPEPVTMITAKFIPPPTKQDKTISETKRAPYTYYRRENSYN